MTTIFGEDVRAAAICLNRRTCGSQSSTSVTFRPTDRTANAKTTADTPTDPIRVKRNGISRFLIRMPASEAT